jgi:hypothetical protein
VYGLTLAQGVQDVSGRPVGVAHTEVLVLEDAVPVGLHPDAGDRGVAVEEHEGTGVHPVPLQSAVHRLAVRVRPDGRRQEHPMAKPAEMDRDVQGVAADQPTRLSSHVLIDGVVTDDADGQRTVQPRHSLRGPRTPDQ